jgi:epoxyqueuosine reductase QueG
MTEIAKEVTKRIKSNGYNAKAVSSIGGRYINGISYGPVSLKHAAVSAGLGHINRNYLLTNLQHGNLLWLSAVVTDAELTPDGIAQYITCDKCNRCVEACPSGALDDPASFGKKQCASTCFKMINKKWELKCFICRTVCPYCLGK